MTRPEARDCASRLGKVELLAQLGDEKLQSIEKRCAWRNYMPGELIIDHLDQSDDVFFIIEGEARANLYSLDGKAVTFCDLKTDEIFGENAAIDGAPRSASVEARTHCLVAIMSGHTFRGLLACEPTVAMILMRQLVARVRNLTTRVYEFSSLAVNNRIQSEILRLASLAKIDEGKSLIYPAPTHADIASRTSTHREAVTRELNRLSRDGIIERQGRALLVKNLDRLTHMVHEATGE